MSPWVVLSRWPAVPYWIVLGVAVVFALLQISGLLGLIAGEHDGDADTDTDADVDADADADGDADDAGESAAHTLLSAALTSVGVGRVPLSVLWQTFAIACAFTGLSCELLFGATWSAFAFSLPPAVAAGYVVTRALAGWLGRTLSPRLATSRSELTGRIGVVISSQVDAHFGEIRISDRSGHVLRVICRSSGAVIPEGSEVVVLETADGRALVDAFDEHLPAP